MYRNLTLFKLKSVIAVNLIAIVAAFTYSVDSNLKLADASVPTRRLQVLSEEYPDGTLLVSVDEMWPPVRIAVQSILDCNLTYPTSGFVPGTFLSVKSSLFQSFPILASVLQAPLHRKSETVESQPSADNNQDQNQRSGNMRRDMRRAAPSSSREDAKIGLRDSANLCSQFTIRAPVLLNFTYIGSRYPKVGDKMTWVYSIQQGSVPLSNITLKFYHTALEGPYTLYSYISRNVSVPWDFQSNGKVTSGSITYKIRSSDLSGTYTMREVVLTTQTCPDYVSAIYFRGNWIYYNYKSQKIKNVIGPQINNLNLFSYYAEPYVLGSGSPFTLIPPELIELKYKGNFSVRHGGDLIWEYKVTISSSICIT